MYGKYNKRREDRGMTHISAIQLAMPTQQERPDLYYVCPQCGVIPPKRLKRLWFKCFCPCYHSKRVEQEYQQRMQAWEQGQRDSCFGAWLGPNYKDHRVIKRMSEMTFENYNRELDANAFALAQKFAQAERPDGNILFCGEFGTGKTLLGSAILNYRRRKWQERTLFATAPQFFQAYDEAMHLPDKEQFIRICERVIHTDLLYLDDIDKEYRGKWEQPKLHTVYYYIFDERYKARRPTIVSTNEYETLEIYIGPAAKSRLLSHCTRVNMMGEDYRAIEKW